MTDNYNPLATDGPKHADPVTTPALIQPDVVISNPVVRKIATASIAVGSLVVAAASIVDQAIPSIDWTSFTDPAAKIVVGLAGLFMIGVTTPNISTKK